jgi:hypothetical protein
MIQILRYYYLTHQNRRTLPIGAIFGMVEIFWFKPDAKTLDSQYYENHNKIYRNDIIHNYINFTADRISCRLIKP